MTLDYVCPHCGGTEFYKNHLFFECVECGTRYVGGIGGKLQKTDIYGHGEGSWGRRYIGASDEVDDDCEYGRTVEARTPKGVSVGSINNGTIIISNADGFERLSIVGHQESSKKRWVAFTLCLFLGFAGIHYFYLNRWGMGALYLLTFGLGGFGWAFDVLRILIVGIKDSDGYYAS